MLDMGSSLASAVGHDALGGSLSNHSKVASKNVSLTVSPCDSVRSKNSDDARFRNHFKIRVVILLMLVMIKS